MKYVYPVTVIWPEYDFPSILCICETEVDAQEMVLSVEQGMAYDEYLFYLEHDRNTKPQQFFYNKEDRPITTACTPKIILY